jgi:hypothetical protein
MMTKTTIAISLALGMSAVVPGARASCVPSAPTGWTVPFSISTMDKATAVASYTYGQLISSTSGANLSGNSTQLFSDRLVPFTCPPLRLCNPPRQPFDINHADVLGVKIATIASSIYVTLTLESWKNAQISFVGHCDTTTGLLYGSASWPPNINNAMFLIQFGTPYNGFIK